MQGRWIKFLGVRILLAGIVIIILRKTLRQSSIKVLTNQVLFNFQYGPVNYFPPELPVLGLKKVAPYTWSKL